MHVNFTTTGPAASLPKTPPAHHASSSARNAGRGLTKGRVFSISAIADEASSPLARTSLAAAVAAERDTPAAPCTRMRPPDAGASSTKVVVAGHAARRFVRVLFSARTWR